MTTRTGNRQPGDSPALLRPRAVLLTAAIGAVLSALLFAVQRESELRESQAAFESAALQRVEVLRTNVARALADLHALAGLYQSGLDIDREAFRRFVAPALAERSDLQSLSWAPRVPAAERARVEAAVRAEGFEDFVFTERDPVTRSTYPAPERTSDYYPILFIEPLEKNISAFGRAIGNPTGSSTFARDSGRIASSVIMPLAQERSNKPGLIIHLPLYDGPVPSSTVERRDRFKGFVTAVFRIADLVAPALDNLEGMRVRVSDANPDPRSVIYLPPALDSSPASRFLRPKTYDLLIGDRTLAITFTPTNSFSPGRRQWASWITLIGGLLITALSTGYLHSWIRRTREIARANAALTSEIQVRKQAEEAAAAANRAKTGFITHLSHEIRTPLNSILGYAQILERSGTLSPRDREAVGAISSGGFHLLDLLNSVLDLSRIEAGRAELHRVAFALPGLIEDVARMLRGRAEEKGLKLQVDCRVPPLRGAVLGDERKLRQILINLASNALKFTHRGSVTLRVEPGSGDSWLFEVIDTGVGMTENERLHLFRPFYQTEEGNRAGGTGLGLAIARAHVQLMGGRLEVESSRGQGSRFFFSLRLPAAVIAPGERPIRALPRLARGVRVQALVVDDSRENRQILARLLADIGCVVAEAGTARDARDLARQSRPDVAFLDVFLAETTGPELLAEMRGDGLAADTPVLLHTAALLSQDQLEALRTDGVDLLQKPFRVEDLCACLSRVPGVRFEDTAPIQAEAEALPSDWPTLPDGLRERIVGAAERHNTTVIRECLREMRQLGGPAARLADHLRGLLRGYDVAAIASCIRALEPGGPGRTPEPAIHA